MQETSIRKFLREEVLRLLYDAPLPLKNKYLLSGILDFLAFCSDLDITFSLFKHLALNLLQVVLSSQITKKVTKKEKIETYFFSSFPFSSDDRKKVLVLPSVLSVDDLSGKILSFLNYSDVQNLSKSCARFYAQYSRPVAVYIPRPTNAIFETVFSFLHKNFEPRLYWVGDGCSYLGQKPCVLQDCREVYIRARKLKHLKKLLILLKQSKNPPDNLFCLTLLNSSQSDILTSDMVVNLPEEKDFLVSTKSDKEAADDEEDQVRRTKRAADNAVDSVSIKSSNTKASIVFSSLAYLEISSPLAKDIFSLYTFPALQVMVVHLQGKQAHLPFIRKSDLKKLKFIYFISDQDECNKETAHVLKVWIWNFLATPNSDFLCADFCADISIFAIFRKHLLLFESNFLCEFSQSYRAEARKQNLRSENVLLRSHSIAETSFLGKFLRRYSRAKYRDVQNYQDVFQAIEKKRSDKVNDIQAENLTYFDAPLCQFVGFWEITARLLAKNKNQKPWEIICFFKSSEYLKIRQKDCQKIRATDMQTLFKQVCEGLRNANLDVWNYNKNQGFLTPRQKAQHTTLAGYSSSRASSLSSASLMSSSLPCSTCSGNSYSNFVPNYSSSKLQKFTNYSTPLDKKSGGLKKKNLLFFQNEVQSTILASIVVAAWEKFVITHNLQVAPTSLRSSLIRCTQKMSTVWPQAICEAYALSIRQHVLIDLSSSFAAPNKNTVTNGNEKKKNLSQFLSALQKNKEMVLSGGGFSKFHDYILTLQELGLDDDFFEPCILKGSAGYIHIDEQNLENTQIPQIQNVIFSSSSFSGKKTSTPIKLLRPEYDVVSYYMQGDVYSQISTYLISRMKAKLHFRTLRKETSIGSSSGSDFCSISDKYTKLLKFEIPEKWKHDYVQTSSPSAYNKQRFFWILFIKMMGFGQNLVHLDARSLNLSHAKRPLLLEILSELPRLQILHLELLQLCNLQEQLKERKTCSFIRSRFENSTRVKSLFINDFETEAKGILVNTIFSHLTALAIKIKNSVVWDETFFQILCDFVASVSSTKKKSSSFLQSLTVLIPIEQIYQVENFTSGKTLPGKAPEEEAERVKDCANILAALILQNLKKDFFLGKIPLHFHIGFDDPRWQGYNNKHVQWKPTGNTTEFCDVYVGRTTSKIVNRTFIKKNILFKATGTSSSPAKKKRTSYRPKGIKQLVSQHTTPLCSLFCNPETLKTWTESSCDDEQQIPEARKILRRVKLNLLCESKSHL